MEAYSDSDKAGEPKLGQYFRRLLGGWASVGAGGASIAEGMSSLSMAGHIPHMPQMYESGEEALRAGKERLSRKMDQLTQLMDEEGDL
jgi:hypothetical protein